MDVQAKTTQALTVLRRATLVLHEAERLLKPPQTEFNTNEARHCYAMALETLQRVPPAGGLEPTHREGLVAPWER
jgi:hypothetical protein